MAVMPIMPPPALITHEGLQALIDALAARDYRVLGPVVRDEAIVYDDLHAVEQLPSGWTDEQAPGRYRLRKRDDQALFGYAVGPQSWKRFLHPPVETLWSARRGGQGIEQGIRFMPPDAPVPKFAFIGVRACELRAIAIQDKVFRDGAYADPEYGRRREHAFVVALNCGVAGGNCFCTSMNCGPRVESGFDLALTELLDARRHVFLVTAGSPAGAELLAQLPRQDAQPADLEQAAAQTDETAKHMGRQLDTVGIRELLRDNATHPRWDAVADRCLSCGNCTMVCPTCFCTTVEDHSSLDGTEAERERRWDSCFTMDFSQLHGGSVRHSTQARYRQWMTHKLSSWIDQFGSSGCVGCGRCISWCPVGIDITEEVAAIRATPQPNGVPGP